MSGDIGHELSGKLCIRLDESSLSIRSKNALSVAGLFYIGDLVHSSPSTLLRLQNFGLKSLRDVEETLRRLGLHLDMTIPGWSPEYARQWRARHQDGIRKHLQRVTLGAVLSRAPRATCLEDELRVAVRAVTLAADVDLVSALWGFGGQGQRTLESVARDRQATGRSDQITRERVRQVAARAQRAITTKLSAGRWLREALRYVDEHLPASVDSIASGLVEAGIARARFHASGLVVAAQIFGQPHRFLIREMRSGNGTVVWPEGKLGAQLDRLKSQLRRLSSKQGCVNLEALLESLGLQGASSKAAAMRFVGLLPSVAWLDEGRAWLVDLDVPRCRLTNNIGKVFAVAQSVHISELRAAIGRHHRVEVLPPRDVLRAFCRHLDFVEVREDWVSLKSGRPPPFRLGPLEGTIAKVLVRHSKVMARPDLEAECILEGMKRNSFYLMLSYSPILSRLARGVYALVGASVPPGLVEDLQPKYGMPRRRMIDDGWTPGGLPWFAVQLSSSMLASGVVRVPAGQKDLLNGAWKLVDNTGGIARQLTVHDASFGNLAPVFRQLGAEPDDVAAFVFSLSNRAVEMSLGTEEVVERLQPEDS